jgi:hypothetical protein
VDDTLILAVIIFVTKMDLAGVIEDILVVMGEPNTRARQCPLAMDKWMNLIGSEHQLALGLIMNTRKMTVALTMKYLSDTLNIIQTTRHFGKKRFRAMEAPQVMGKLGRITE